MIRQHLKSILLGSAVMLTSFGLSAAPAQAETLSEALVAVYNKNPQLLAERARLREVDETYIQARAQGRFTVAASGQYSRTVLDGPPAGVLQNVGPVPLVDPTSDNTFFYAPAVGQIEIVQPLYQGGRVKALKAQAKAGILAQRESLRATENQLFLSAANAYINVQLAEEAAIIRRNNVRVLDRQLLAANERFNVGQGTRTDIAQSESRLAGAEAGLAQADAELQSARAVYRRFVGRMPVDLQSTPSFAVPNTLEDALRRARENSPQLIAAYFGEQAGKAAIDVAKAAGRPTLSLSGSVGAQRGELFGFEDAETASLTAQINIPIFSGGLNSSRVRQAKHAKTRLAFESRDAELSVDQTVAQAWAQRQSAEATLKASRKQVRSAEIAFEGVTLEQELGNRTQLDVLDAEQELLEAKLSVINSERNLNAATFQLLATIGVFDAQGLGLTIDRRYDPDVNFQSVRYDGLTELIDRTIAEPVQAISKITYDAASELVTDLENVLENDSEENGFEPLLNALETSKVGTDWLLGTEPEISPLSDAVKPKVETEPFEGESLRNLPDLESETP